MRTVGGAVGKVVAAVVAVLFVIGLAAAASGPKPEVAFTFADPAIVESSGLLARDGLFVTVNDSGDTGRVFTVDPDDGRTVGVTTWSAEPTDVEAVAPAGPGEVWVGDIGDNLAARESVSVARVPVGRGDRSVEAPTYELTYPGGPQDAETLLTDPGTGALVVVTKGVFGGDVFVAPQRLDPDRATRMRRVGTAMGIATDGAFFPDGRHLIVRGYASATVYTWPGLDEVGRLDLPGQEQGEGVAVDEDGAVYVSSEGVESDVLRIELPRRVVRAMEPPAPPSDPADPADPSTSTTPEDDDSPAAQPPAETSDDDRDLWPWAVGGLAGVLVVAVVVRSLRPRG